MACQLSVLGTRHYQEEETNPHSYPCNNVNEKLPENTKRVVLVVSMHKAAKVWFGDFVLCSHSSQPVMTLNM
jgi:hypothetical protein